MARLFVVCLLSILPVFAMAKTTLKLSTLYPPGTDAVTSLQRVAAEIKTATDGEVEIKVYPGGVMGDDKTVLRKIRVGQLNGALISGTGLDLITPDLKDLSKPFQFDDISEVYALRETKDAELRSRLEGLDWQGYGPLDGGFSYLMSKQQITDMTAVRSAKLWLPNTSDIQEMARALDVNYLVMNIGDVLTGLDTGAIDTLISPPAAAITLNWHSRFNYFTTTPVMYTWGMLVIPERSLNRIPDNYRSIVDTALTEWAQGLDARNRQGNARALDALNQLLEAQSFNRDDIQQLRLSQK